MSSLIEDLRREAEMSGDREETESSSSQKLSRAPKPLASGKQAQVFDDEGEEEESVPRTQQAFRAPQPRQAAISPRQAHPFTQVQEHPRLSSGSDDGSNQDGSSSRGGDGEVSQSAGAGGEIDGQRRARIEARAARLRDNEEREDKQLVQRRDEIEPATKKQPHSAFSKDTGLRTATTKLDHQDVFGKRSQADGLLDSSTTKKPPVKRGGPAGGLDLDAGTLARSNVSNAREGGGKPPRAGVSVRSSVERARLSGARVTYTDEDEIESQVGPMRIVEPPEKVYSRHLPRQPEPPDEAAQLVAELARLKAELNAGEGDGAYDISSDSDQEEPDPMASVKEARRQREAQNLDKFKRMPARGSVSEVRASVYRDAKERSQKLRELNNNYDTMGGNQLNDRDESSSEGEGNAEIPAHRVGPGQDALVSMGRTGSVIFCPECGEPSPAGAAFCSCSEPLGDQIPFSHSRILNHESPPKNHNTETTSHTSAPHPAANNNATARPLTAQSDISTTPSDIKAFLRAPSANSVSSVESSATAVEPASHHHRVPTAMSESSEASLESATTASEMMPATQRRVRIQTANTEASESEASSVVSDAPQPLMGYGAFPKAPPSRRRKMREPGERAGEASAVQAPGAAQTAPTKEGSEPEKQGPGDSSKAAHDNPLENVNSKPTKQSPVKASAPTQHKDGKLEQRPTNRSPTKAHGNPHAAGPEKSPHKQVGKGATAKQSSDEDEEWKTRALMEADDLLSTLAPPRVAQITSSDRRETPATIEDTTRAAAAPGVDKSSPSKDAAKKHAPMMDPFLRSLGGPSVHTDWDMEGAADESAGRVKQEDESIFSKGTERLLSLQGKTAENSRRNPQRRRDMGAVDTSFTSQAPSHATAASHATASSVYSVMMDASVVKALRETKALFDEGVLTEEEFRAQKAIILNQNISKTVHEADRHAADAFNNHSINESVLLHAGARDHARLSQAERAKVLSGLNDDDDNDDAPPRARPVVVRAKEKVFDGIAHHVTRDATEGEAAEVHMMMRPPSASTVMSDVEQVRIQHVEPVRFHPQRPVSSATSIGTIGNFMRTASDIPDDGTGFSRAQSGGTDASGGAEEGWEAGRGDSGDLGPPLFMKDHNEEVERLQALARRELEAATQETYDDEPDEGSVRESRVPEVLRRKKQADEPVVEYITDEHIKESWRKREALIAVNLEYAPTSFSNIPAPAMPPSDDASEGGSTARSSMSVMSAMSASLSTTTSVSSVPARHRHTHRPSWKAVWGPDGVQEEDQDGWGSDVSSGDDAPYMPEPERDPFLSEEPQQDTARPASSSDTPGDDASTAAQEDLSPTGRGAAAALGAEAKRLETEARLLREAAQHAKEQEEKRYAAEREAEAARAEAEMLRKQLAAMDDRIKASKKLEERIKEGAVAYVLDVILEQALSLCVPPTRPPSFNAFRTEDAVSEKAKQDTAQHDVAGRDDLVPEVGLEWQEGEGDGEDEVRAWQAKRSIAMGRHAAAAAARHAANREQILAKAAEKEMSSSSNNAHTTTVGNNNINIGTNPDGTSKWRAPIVRDDISSSSEDYDEEGEETQTEDVETEEEMDPELLVKLRVLSAVLIQRAYRSYSAHKLAKAAAKQAKKLQAERRASVQVSQQTTEKAAARKVSAAESVKSILSSVKSMFTPRSAKGDSAEKTVEQDNKRGKPVDSARGHNDSVSSQGHSAPGRKRQDSAPADADEDDTSAEAVRGGPGTLEGTQGSLGSTKASFRKEQDAKKEGLLRKLRTALRERDFDDAAEVFVYMEHHGKDYVTVQELERGAKLLKLVQCDVQAVLAAVGKRGSQDRISYKDFTKLFSWGTETSVSAWGCLEAARLKRRSIVDRVQKALSVSEEMLQRKQNLDKKRDEAWEQLSALRKQLSARGPASSRSLKQGGSRSERIKSRGEAAPLGRGAGHHTTREGRRSRGGQKPQLVGPRTARSAGGQGAAREAAKGQDAARESKLESREISTKGGAADRHRQSAAACIMQACARMKMAGRAYAAEQSAAAAAAVAADTWEVDMKATVGRKPRVWSDSESDDEDEGWLGLGGGRKKASPADAAAHVAADRVGEETDTRVHPGGEDASVDQPTPAQTDGSVPAVRPAGEDDKKLRGSKSAGGKPEGGRLNGEKGGKKQNSMDAALRQQLISALGGDSSDGSDDDVRVVPSVSPRESRDEARAPASGVELKSRDMSARVIQRVFRGHVSRVFSGLEAKFQRAERLDKAATMIQKRTRGMLVRSKVPTAPLKLGNNHGARSMGTAQASRRKSLTVALDTPSTVAPQPDVAADFKPTTKLLSASSTSTSDTNDTSGYVNAFPSRGSTAEGSMYPSRASTADSSVVDSDMQTWAHLASMPIAALDHGAPHDPFPPPPQGSPQTMAAHAEGQDDALSRTDSASSRGSTADASLLSNRIDTKNSGILLAVPGEGSEGPLHNLSRKSSIHSTSSSTGARGDGDKPYGSPSRTDSTSSEVKAHSFRGSTAAASDATTAKGDAKRTPAQGQQCSADSNASSASESLKASNDIRSSPPKATRSKARPPSIAEGMTSPTRARASPLHSPTAKVMSPKAWVGSPKAKVLSPMQSPKAKGLMGSPMQSPKAKGLMGSPMQSPKAKGLMGSPMQSPKAKGLSPMLSLSPAARAQSPTAAARALSFENSAMACPRVPSFDNNISATSAQAPSRGHGLEKPKSALGMPPKAPVAQKRAPSISVTNNKVPADTVQTEETEGPVESMDVFLQQHGKGKTLKLKQQSRKGASEPDGKKHPSADSASKGALEGSSENTKQREYLKAKNEKKNGLRQPSSEMKEKSKRSNSLPQTLFLTMDEPDEQAHARWVMSQLAGDLGPPFYPETAMKKQAESTDSASTQNSQFLTSKPPLPRSHSALGITFTPMETVVEEKERLSTAGSVDLERSFQVSDASRGSTRQSNRPLTGDDARQVEEVLSFLRKLRARMQVVQGQEEEAASQENFRQAAEHQEELVKLKEGENRLLKSIATLLGRDVSDIDVESALFSSSSAHTHKPSTQAVSGSTVKQVVPRYMNAMGVNVLALTSGGKASGKVKQGENKGPPKQVQSAYTQALRVMKHNRSAIGSSKRAWPPADSGGEANKHVGLARTHGGVPVPMMMDSDSDEESAPLNPTRINRPSILPSIPVASGGPAAARYAARQHVNVYKHELRSASR